jgi:uncharacterized protein YoaH (UPF0181 family)
MLVWSSSNEAVAIEFVALLMRQKHKNDRSSNEANQGANLS